MGLVIRPATPADVPWLRTELDAFDQFFGAAHSLIPTDPNYAVTLLHQLIGEHVFLVAERDGEPTGFIAGLLGPHLFNPAIIVLTELFWWVPVTARGGRAGARLLDAFIAEGKARAQWIVFTLEERSPVHASALESRGFALHERSYLREVAG